MRGNEVEAAHPQKFAKVDVCEYRTPLTTTVIYLSLSLYPHMHICFCFLITLSFCRKTAFGLALTLTSDL